MNQPPKEATTQTMTSIVAAVDQMHAINQRDWPAESSALKRGNDLVDVIAPACGLR